MKKVFSHITAAIIIGIFLQLNVVSAATADTTDGGEDEGELDAANENIKEMNKLFGEEALGPAINNHCIDIDKKGGGSDAGKIVEIIEEPFSSNTSETQIEDLEIRRCYRHTFQYTENSKLKIVPVLSKTACGDVTAAAIANDPSNIQKYHTKYSCREVQALLSTGGTAIIYGYIGMVYRWGASIVGIIAVLVIVLSGIQIAAAGGETEVIGKAKTRILQSLGGIAVLFLSGLILYTINPTFFIK